jgi:tetratricopeptide (TPR) repeat protein
MRRSVDLKFLAALLAAGTLTSVGLYFLHGYQLRRAAPLLLAEAARAEQDGQPGRALEYLAYYHRCVPEDGDALVRYGRLLDERSVSAEERRAVYHVFAEALEHDPRRADLRRRLVQLALDLGELATARKDLGVLLEASPDDGDLEDLRGRYHEAAREYAQAADWFGRSVRHAPHQLDTYARLARLWRLQLNRPDRADQVMDDLVAANEQSAAAYLLRARYRRELGELEPVAADLSRARALSPDDADAHLLAGQVALARGRLDEARACLQRGLALAPRRAGMYVALAEAELRSGRRPEALACLRRGLEEAPDHGEVLPPLIDLLLQEGRVDEAGKALDRLREAGFSPGWLAYFEARLLLPRGQWARAAGLLEQARAQLTAPPELAGKINLYLGQCREQLEDPDGALDVYRRAVTLDAAALPAHLRFASALLAAGRAREAVRELQAVQRRPDAPAAGWALLARALLLRNLGLPPGQRDWEEVNRALDQAARATPDAVEVPVLRAEALAAQGQPDAARAVLEKARDARPGRVALWEALALLAQRAGQPEAGLKVLDEARQRLGDVPGLRVARATYWARRGGPEALPALGDLETGLDGFNDAEQGQLLGALAVAHFRVGDAAGAERLWGRLAVQRPDDLRTRLLLFDLAAQTGREDALAGLLRDIRRIEGDDGALYRYGEAMTLLLRARRGDRQGLEQARRRAAEVAERRPLWSRAALLQAVLDELDGDPDKAAEDYLQAVKRGERRPEILRRLLGLLYERRRYAEAEQVLRDLREQVPLAGAVARLGTAVELAVANPEQALELARQAVPPGSTDYHDYLWLGQVLTVLGKPAEAEPALRRAVQLGPSAADARVALVQCLATAGRRAEAEAALHEARTALTGPQAPLALAACCEALARWDEAAEQYRAALAARPDDVSVLQAAAAYALRREQPRQAEPPLRKLLAPETRATAAETAWARRSLALALGTGGDYRQFRDALALLEHNLQDHGGSPDDRRAQAVLLAVRPGHRREAIRRFEELARARPLTPDEQFVLAQLYDADREWPQARDLLLQVLAADRANPDHLAYYAGALLRHGDPGTARAAVEQLDRLAPDAAATVEAKARLLAAEDRGEEATALLTGYARRPGVEPERVAALLEELGRLQAAEELYRRGAAGPAQPRGTLALAGYLGRHEHVAEAVDLCERALRAQPREPALLRGLADLRERQRRYTEAGTLYRQVLEREPDDVAALNNLAGLLSGNEGDHAAALELIGRALDRAGPLPALRDTHALIVLRTGRPDAAVKELEEAVGEAPTAVRYFHLAQAYRAARSDRAAETWARAAAAGLRPDDLDAFERTAYEKLQAELKLR